jgi:hypothetical protein
VIAISDVRTDRPGGGVCVLDKQLQISVHSKWNRTYYLTLNSNEEARRWEQEIRPFIPYRVRNSSADAVEMQGSPHISALRDSDPTDPSFELFVGQSPNKV